MVHCVHVFILFLAPYIIIRLHSYSLIEMNGVFLLCLGVQEIGHKNKSIHIYSELDILDFKNIG